MFLDSSAQPLVEQFAHAKVEEGLVAKALNAALRFHADGETLQLIATNMEHASSRSMAIYSQLKSLGSSH